MQDLTAAAGQAWGALEVRAALPVEQRFDWRHGWVPLTPEAVASKLHHTNGHSSHVAVANKHGEAAFREGMSSAAKPRTLHSRAENEDRLGRVLAKQGNHSAAAEHFGRAHGLHQAAEAKAKEA